ncbi:hypothetical protein SDC9_136911 [bioreactor metagenome]|uniref:Uncharacterized protein n=1 Tax=bioreactor metagenome TaxID=1076179 RepID=A0A645DKG5_9ZZZZ
MVNIKHDNDITTSSYQFGRIDFEFLEIAYTSKPVIKSNFFQLFFLPLFQQIKIAKAGQKQKYK